MNLGDKINIVLCVLSFLLAVISVVTVVITLRQNSKMIENSTRPYIIIYGKKINVGIQKYYLVIKNFGSSGGIITNFESEINLAEYTQYAEIYKQNTFSHIIGTHLAPQQRIECVLDVDKLIEHNIEKLAFKIEYTGTKTYTEKVIVNYIAETENGILRKHQEPETELTIISDALQGIGESLL